ncbi:MAG: chorismate synthase [Bacteroidetes bacterium MED-G13]|nr:MAG: chorismate synthase [Bacteroidetes bacterium MED-G13]|tara:strand:+ start:16720 stop:17781 length:1062 start_codon:yes stop_codon:yes gene_type:complete
MNNSFGNIFKLTTFGESHGKAIGGIIDGCPSGHKIDFNFISNEMNRRKPGQSKIVTQRKENDSVEFLSGIFNGITTGTPIGFIIKNNDQKSKDYDHLKNSYRPSHADFVYEKKYGTRDYRGGGRSSARETACRVVAGAIAKQILKDISIHAYTSSIGNISIDENYEISKVEDIEKSIVRCPDNKISDQMIHKVKEARKNGDTLGGIVKCVIKNVPIGLGEPVFNKLHSELGRAMLSINAVKGFEYGSGFRGTKMKGSEHNDIILKDLTTETNFSGGIQGGISNGMDIYFNVAFKPVATIMKNQNSIDSNGKKSIIEGKGRHDPCVVPRAIPIVEAMAAIVILDYYLINKTKKI